MSGRLARRAAGTALAGRRRLSIAALSRRGLEEGLLGGDRRWLAVGGVAWTAALVRWAWRRTPEVVYRTRLRPGETLVISARPQRR